MASVFSEDSRLRRLVLVRLFEIEVVISKDLQMSVEAISADLMQTDKKRTVSPNITSQRESLPVFQYRDHLLETIGKNPVTLIKGETGCGKSTQVIIYYKFEGEELTE